MAHVVRPLVRAGILESREGISGGYRLLKDPATVTVQDIVAAEEGGVVLAACLDATKHYACPQKSHCTVRQSMPIVQRLILQTLSKHTLADLVAQNTK